MAIKAHGVLLSCRHVTVSCTLHDSTVSVPLSDAFHIYGLGDVQVRLHAHPSTLTPLSPPEIHIPPDLRHNKLSYVMNVVAVLWTSERWAAHNGATEQHTALMPSHTSLHHSDMSPQTGRHSMGTVTNTPVCHQHTSLLLAHYSLPVLATVTTDSLSTGHVSPAARILARFRQLLLLTAINILLSNHNKTRRKVFTTPHPICRQHVLSVSLNIFHIFLQKPYP